MTTARWPQYHLGRRDQLDSEDKRGVGGNASSRSRTVSKTGLNDELSDATNFHRCHALGPACDHSTERKLRAVISIKTSAVEQPAFVIYGDRGRTRCRTRASADKNISIFEA